MNEAAVPARALTRASRQDAVVQVSAQLRATLDLLRSLTADDWSRPTDCEGWSVTDVVAHLVGQYQECARPWVMLRRLRAAARLHPDLARIDGHNRRQVAELSRQSPPALLAALDRFGPLGLRALQRLPEPVRRIRASLPFPGSALPEDDLGYVFDVLAPRDTWMHRVDLARATDRRLVTTPADRHVVAQVIRDLSLAWTADPVVLELTGAGAWLLGEGEPVATARVEAVEYLRAVSGRAVAPAIEVHGDETIASALAAARVPF